MKITQMFISKKNCAKCVLLLVLLTVALALPAQDQQTVKSMGGGGFTIGYGSMNLSPLHNFVPDAVPSFSKQHLLLGGEGHGMTGNLVMGGGGCGIMGDDIRTDSLGYNLGGGMGTFDIGYMLLDRDQLKIYPMIGIGGYGYGIKINRLDNTSAKDVRTDPSREINISKGGVVGDFSLTLNFIPLLKYDEKDHSYGGLMTGLKVGYLYGPPSSRWSYSGGNVTGGPRFGMNMFYVKLIVGGMGYQKGS